MRRLISFFIICFISLLYTSCGKHKDPAEIRLIHWGDLQEIELMNKIIADIKTEKGVIVRQERAPAGNAFMEKVLTEFASDNAPDVIFTEVNTFKEFADKGVLEDLTPYISAEKEINPGDYYPEVIQRFTMDNKLYVLPRDIAPICVIYYNKQMFDNAGLKYPSSDWDWRQFLDTAKKLSKVDAKGVAKAYGFLDQWPIWETWAVSNGGRLVDDVKNPKKCLMDSREVIDAIQFRADMMYKYRVMPVPSQLSAMGFADAGDMFTGGKVAMFYSGLWKAPYFRKIRDFDWDIVMFPKGPSGKRAFMTGGSGYAINRKSKHKAAAWELVKRLAGARGQKEMAQIGLLQPAIKSIAGSPAFLDGQKPLNKKIMLDAVESIVFYPRLSKWEEINIGMTAPALDKVWSGKETAEKAMKTLVPEINKTYFEGK